MPRDRRRIARSAKARLSACPRAGGRGARPRQRARAGSRGRIQRGAERKLNPPAPALLVVEARRYDGDTPGAMPLRPFHDPREPGSKRQERGPAHLGRAVRVDRGVGFGEHHEEPVVAQEVGASPDCPPKVGPSLALAVRLRRRPASTFWPQHHRPGGHPARQLHRAATPRRADPVEGDQDVQGAGDRRQQDASVVQVMVVPARDHGRACPRHVVESFHAKLDPLAHEETAPDLERAPGPDVVQRGISDSRSAAMPQAFGSGRTRRRSASAAGARPASDATTAGSQRPASRPSAMAKARFAT